MSSPPRPTRSPSAASDFDVAASYGAVLLPHEAASPDYALQLADERMYALKQSRNADSREQTRDVLMRIMQAREPPPRRRARERRRRARHAVGHRLGMSAEQLDELARAAELHDVGKVGVPDAILDKPGELDADEWEFIRRHTVLGERILTAAPALRPGRARSCAPATSAGTATGYPDALAGEAIPLGARIVAVCDAYEAMITERSYRSAMSRAAARGTSCAARPAASSTRPWSKAFLETFDERSEERPQPVEIPHAQSPGDVAAHLRAVLERTQA